MKRLTKENVKKHARKIRDVTSEQFDELQEGYVKLMGEVRGMDAPALLFISFIGIAIILLFNNAIFDLIGFIVFAYPFYLFVQQGGHHEGYCEGYYDRMTKSGEKQDEKKGEHGKHEQKESGESR